VISNSLSSWSSREVPVLDRYLQSRPFSISCMCVTEPLIFKRLPSSWCVYLVKLCSIPQGLYCTSGPMAGLFFDNLSADWNCENFQLRNLHGLCIMRPEILLRSVDTTLLANLFSFTVTRYVFWLLYRSHYHAKGLEKCNYIKVTVYRVTSKS